MINFARGWLYHAVPQSMLQYIIAVGSDTTSKRIDLVTDWWAWVRKCPACVAR